jgi:hypothetical protein
MAKAVKFDTSFDFGANTARKPKKAGGKAAKRTKASGRGRRGKGGGGGS